MTCKPTNVPAASEIDIDQIKEKYQYERDKRIRPERQDQYLLADEVFEDLAEVDPHTPLIERDPISEDLDVAVLGAGWSGLLSAYHLRQAGVANFRNIDVAGDFGGCWYWNQYPGLQCDNEAYCYIPLLEETGFIPSKKFADGWEIHEHFQRVATQFDLYENALFHTLITSLRWDESIDRWRIETNRGDEIRARFVIMGGGPANTPKLPRIDGLRQFNGKTFHTSRWEYDYTGGDRRHPVLDKLADKRVAILGTGASAIQAIPYLGKYAKQLYVVQRTPSSVDFRNNTPTPPEWIRSLKPGWQKERQTNYHRGMLEAFLPGDEDMVCDIWTEISRNLAVEFEAEGWPALTFDEYMARREVMDYQVMERLRRRVDELVEDKTTAEALKPYFRMLCKRPTSNDEYYPTFNRPNVKLIDVSATRGLDRMTERGFMHDGIEYEIDCMIFASGFEQTSELSRRWAIEVVEGSNGLSLYDHWADTANTLHGATTHGFPNMFFTGLIQGGLHSSLTVALGQQSEHIASIIAEAQHRGATRVEPTQQAQDEWAKTIRATAIDLTSPLRDCTPGYYNNDGGDKIRSYLGEFYGPGWFAYLALLNEWRANGMEGLAFTSDPIKALTTA
jgi:cation diffusion facilitator CzcD-associated flavoprotein CzcO